MHYISTRGQAPHLDFAQATLTGLANDGGLYLPATWPQLSVDEMRAAQHYTYAELTAYLLAKFTGDTLPPTALASLAADATRAFQTLAPIKPLPQLDAQLYLVELFHGPTLAFKDYALQLLGRLLAYFLHERDQTCTILGATSGDTGPAAIAGVSGLESVTLYMLHPRGRVSAVQRRQMTTVAAPNIHNIAIDGTFDDCQNLVKMAFNDAAFRQQHRLTAVNSINWARIAAQVIYYFHAALALGAPDRAVNFAVPTGNFGNIFAGYVARKMGLPIARLIIGSNRNDILTRFFATGTMQTKTVTPTLSPSMDIQISSNFERYLFELLARDRDHLNRLMTEFSDHGAFQLEAERLRTAQAEFSAYRFDDQQIRTAMAATYQATGEIIDPHSMIAVAAAQADRHANAHATPHADTTPTIVLATAHPAKFPKVITETTGQSAPLPATMANILTREEHYTSLPNDLSVLQAFIRANT